MNQNMMNAQKYGDRYGHGAPTTVQPDLNATAPTVNSAPFSNPYEGKPVLMEGEEANQLNEHNVYAKAMANKDSFKSAGDTSMVNEDDRRMKLILGIGGTIVVVIIISVLVALFL